MSSDTFLAVTRKLVKVKASMPDLLKLQGLDSP